VEQSTWAALNMKTTSCNEPTHAVLRKFNDFVNCHVITFSPILVGCPEARHIAVASNLNSPEEC
jgi:hypothetical protein